MNNFNQGYNPQNGYVPPQNGYYPYGTPYRNPNELQKINDKKILRTMGSLYGASVIFYFFMSFAVSFLILAISKIFPSAELIYSDRLMNEAFSVIASVIFIGLPFFTSFLILKAKKYTGNLPLGTTYNRKASASLVMMMLPVVLFTTMAINLISISVQDSLGVTFSSGFEDLTVKGAPQIVMFILSTAVIPALVEEIAIRGIILEPLRRYGDLFAIICSALIFSLLHGNMVQVPYTLFAGIYFGYIAVTTGSIWPSVILHFLNNMFSVIVNIANSYGGVRMSGVVTLIMLAVVIIVGIIGAVIYFSLNYKVKLKKGVKTLGTGEKISALFLNIPMIFAGIFIVFSTLASISKS